MEAMTTSIESAGETPSFGPELFAFLVELRAHNDRDWFAANKERYEAHVLEPALAFIEDFGYRLQEISPHFIADPRRSGGSLFRIYRDTRFAKDKSPYKTNTGMYFRHARGKDVHAPGYYLHLAPGEVFGGGGIWHPDTKALTAIRQAIVDDPDGWARAKRLGDGLELGGDSLKRVPTGFDKEHPHAEDLKRKDFFASVRLDEADATAPGFLDRYTRICESASPLMRFLCGALDVAY
jgi:uncharacterized protein (TIGR02453 family)